MPCKETDCKCEATKTELIAAGLVGIFGHDEYGNCRNPKCGHPVLNHTDASAADADFEVVPVSGEQMESLKKYSMVASQMHRDDMYAAIDECAMSEDRPFIAFDGPSGVGKTQTALSLTKKKFLYLLLTRTGGDTLQDVYKPFFRQSSQLRLCAEKDMASLGHGTYGVTTFDMSTFPPEFEFLTLGYLYQLWNRMSNKKPWPIEQAELRFKVLPLKLTMAKFRELCGPFLLILDETPFVRFHSEERKFVKFIRNLARHVGVVIMSGTDSALVNMVGSLASRDEALEHKKKWCIVFTQFSKPTYLTLQVRYPDLTTWLVALPVQLRRFTEYVIRTHRPLLVDLFVKSLMARWSASEKKKILKVLNSVVAHIARTLVDMKGKGDKKMFWTLGQQRLPLSSYRITDERDYCIHGHMAYLTLQSPAVLELVPGQMDVCLNGRPFKPRASFPTAQKEALLYMALLGCPERDGFPDIPALTDEYTSTRLSLCRAMSSPSSSTNVQLGNPNAYASSGDKYEVMLAVGTVLASHHGLEGQSVINFLRKFLFEVCNSDFAFSNTTCKLLENWFGSRKIPYMAPLDSRWPAELIGIPGVVVATPTRPPNQNQVDLETLFVGESETKEDEEGKIETEKKKGEESDEDLEGDAVGEADTETDDDDDDDDDDYDKEAQGDAPIGPTGESKNRNTISLKGIVQRVPEASEFHIVLARNTCRRVRRSTREIIAARRILLMRVVVKHGKWHFSRFFPGQKRSRSGFLHMVLLIDWTEIAKATGQEFEQPNLKRKT